MKDCLGMLYENSDPSAIRMATLYLMGGTSLPVGTLNSISNTLQQIFKQQDVVDVSLAMPNSQSVKVHLLAAVHEKTRFDNYDPLGEVIPKENILDWDEMDSSPDIQITIPKSRINHKVVIRYQKKLGRVKFQQTRAYSAEGTNAKFVLYIC